MVAPDASKFTLFYTPVHEFVHKYLVTAHEAGIWDRLEVVPIYPRREGYGLGAINPLAKVPTLALPDGKTLFGSQTICEFFDSFNAAASLYPARGPARWDALTRLSLGDITFELAIKVGYEPQEAHHALTWLNGIGPRSSVPLMPWMPTPTSGPLSTSAKPRCCRR